MAGSRPRVSTNLTDVLEMARGQLVATDWKRYIVILTDGFPDAPESAVEQALAARGQGIEIVAIGTGDADRDYLGRLASRLPDGTLRPVRIFHRDSTRAGETAVFIPGMVVPAGGWSPLFLALLTVLAALALVPSWLSRGKPA